MNIGKRIAGLLLIISGLVFLVYGLLPATFESVQQTLAILDEYPSTSIAALIPLVFGFLLGLLPEFLCLAVIWKGYQWLRNTTVPLTDSERAGTDITESESKSTDDNVDVEYDNNYTTEIAARYSEMTDDELSELKPSNLTEIVRKCYEEEIKRRENAG